MLYGTDLIRNVALAGHGSTGKTSLVEHLLFSAGAIAKPETIESGKTASDYNEEEIERKISVRASLSYAEYNGKKLNFLDAPGSADFIGEVILALRAAESAIILVDGRSGVQIETMKVWRNLESRGKPRMFFVNKLDEERASFATAVADITDKFSVHPVAITVPMGEGTSFQGVIDVLNEKAYPLPKSHDQKEIAGEVPAAYKEAVAAARSALSEAAADGDDELMAKYLDHGTLSQAEIVKGLSEALAENRIIPVFAGAGLKNSGCLALLDFIAQIAPNPTHLATERVKLANGSEAELAVTDKGPLAGLVIKTQIDQFSGRLSYIKIIRGILTTDIEFLNVDDNKKEKPAKLYTALGKKLVEARELHAGDIGIIAKSPSLKTSETIAALDSPLHFVPLRLPMPVHAVAVTAVNKKEEDKLAEILHKAAEEDLTFTVRFDAETKETVISGMGELQINMLLDKIKHHQKIDVETRIPRIAYRETVQKKAGGEHTHKKQSGGHGQYGKVVLEVEPLARGSGYGFENKVFGGSVSKGFVPGIEKGIHQAMERGIMAGYPVVDVKSSLMDGKEHAVDSSEMAFKIAARGAFREACKNAGPTLLEPVMNLEVFVEEKYLGDVMSDLSSRRGRIAGQNPIGGGIIEIKGQVPQAELLRYSIDLRAKTSGTGSFEIDFDHYAPISGKIADDVIKAAEAFHIHEAEED
ncbi:MAG: GTP-binding protein [Spirochaetes bacterium GWD1_61_31]|nr:MAG: GTP-binding protein [Spirochaetes bacterium GWB1_60_80]OHD32211.1 MAG: GTP-binding protein [Spirochaetes bacterium GWC1_61_12]OHD36710.1 MAG: GTP-binding protein [Spirochaetes bacterium GWD1_61_31]OHD42532.1 MAG: GTP-binding protein [Spirochaetes bacterium GWE1_60_18]OHD57896.1 MAG: GTP-binding protein [Spirochaetes bacterium GWF1_60_12]HAP42593.1 elongation factor G [Spirochaetaceae bacterium]